MLAYDRASVRSLDENGRLHVEKSHISKSTVNPYFGKEIPGYEKLGLEPDKKYYLLRHPDELAKAVKTFNNIPILKKHVPVTADAPRQDLIIGSTGTDAEFNHPYLDNSLVFWTKPEIDEIESNKKKQLSCAYSYDPIMEPGVFEGMPFDGIMTNLKGNHLALVEEGRAGPDVVVGDSMDNYSFLNSIESEDDLTPERAAKVWALYNRPGSPGEKEAAKQALIRGGAWREEDHPRKTTGPHAGEFTSKASGSTKRQKTYYEAVKEGGKKGWSRSQGPNVNTWRHKDFPNEVFEHGYSHEPGGSWWRHRAKGSNKPYAQGTNAQEFADYLRKKGYDNIVRDFMLGNDSVVVGDSKLGGNTEVKMPELKLSPKALYAKGALVAYLGPRLAQDARINLTPIVEGVTSRNFKTKRPIIEYAVKHATRGKLAQDADLDDLPQLLEALERHEEEPPEEDEGTNILAGGGMGQVPDLPIHMDKVLGFLKDKLSPDHYGYVKDELSRAGTESDPPFGSNVSQMVKDMRRDADDADKRKKRAADHLGRDESEEEEKEREERESEDRRRHDADDRRLMSDYRHARDRYRKAKDALDRRHDADDRRHDDADDKRLDEDCKDAKASMDRAFDKWRKHRAKDKRDDDDADDRRGKGRDRRHADDDPPDFEGVPKTGAGTETEEGDKRRHGMDAATVNAMIARQVAETRQEQRAVNDAARFVRPWVGDLAMDSFTTANDVYKTALKMLGKNVDNLHPDSYKPILESIERPGSKQPRRHALDSIAMKSFSERFPETTRIQHM